jgi:hypothetical protein
MPIDDILDDLPEEEKESQYESVVKLINLKDYDLNAEGKDVYQQIKNGESTGDKLIDRTIIEWGDGVENSVVIRTESLQTRIERVEIFKDYLEVSRGKRVVEHSRGPIKKMSYGGVLHNTKSSQRALIKRYGIIPEDEKEPVLYVGKQHGVDVIFINTGKKHHKEVMNGSFTGIKNGNTHFEFDINYNVLNARYNIEDPEEDDNEFITISRDHIYDSDEFVTVNRQNFDMSKTTPIDEMTQKEYKAKLQILGYKGKRLQKMLDEQREQKARVKAEKKLMN